MKHQIKHHLNTLTLWTFAFIFGIPGFMGITAKAQTLSSFAHMRHSFELRTSTRYHFDEMPLSGWTYEETSIDPRLNFSYQLRVNRSSLLSTEVDVFYNLQPTPNRSNFYTQRFDRIFNITYQHEYIQLKKAVYGLGLGLSHRAGYSHVGKYFFGFLNYQHLVSYNAIGINMAVFFKYPLWRRWHLVAATDFTPYLKVWNDRLGNSFHLPENQYLWRAHMGLGYKVGRIPKKYVTLPKRG